MKVIIAQYWIYTQITEIKTFTVCAAFKEADE